MKWVLINIFFLIVLISCQLNEGAEYEKNTFSKESMHYLKWKVEYDTLVQNGDILLFEGGAAISRLIIKQLNESVPVSHCAIVERTNDSLFIIHSVARELSGIDGMQRSGLKEFIRAGVKKMYRVRHRSDSSNRYQILKEAKLLLKENKPFDYAFDYKDTSKVYCSELVYHTLFKTYGINYFKSKKFPDNELLLFNSLLDTSYFDIKKLD